MCTVCELGGRIHPSNYSSIILIFIPIPAWPVTHERRRKSITPQMFRRHRTKTPLIHPNFTVDSPGASPLAPSFGVPSVCTKKAPHFGIKKLHLASLWHNYIHGSQSHHRSSSKRGCVKNTTPFLTSSSFSSLLSIFTMPRSKEKKIPTLI
jgi:hypothetical protein